MISYCQPLSGHSLLFWEGTLVESTKSGMASQVVEVAPSSQFFVLVCGFASTMRCTCSDFPRSLTEFLHLPLIHRVPLTVLRRCRILVPIFPTFLAMMAKRHLDNDVLPGIQQQLLCHSVTQARNHQILDRT
jgi:hypothetical protein